MSKLFDLTCAYFDMLLIALLNHMNVINMHKFNRNELNRDHKDIKM